MGGGTVGLETAETIAARSPGSNITVVEILSKAGRDLGGKKWIMMGSLKEKGVKILTETKITRASRNEVCIQDSEGERKLKADSIIFAAGYKARKTDTVTDILQRRNISYEIVGDCDEPSDVMNGSFNAYAKVNGLERDLLI